MKTFRSLAIRTIGWAIGVCASLLAIATLVLALYVLFFDYSEHLKGWMERETSRILGREVRIGHFNVYLPNSFEIAHLSARSRHL